MGRRRKAVEPETPPAKDHGGWIVLGILAAVIGYGACVVMGNGTWSPGNSATEHVKGYTKKDGTRVRPHERRK